MSSKYNSFGKLIFEYDELNSLNHAGASRADIRVISDGVYSIIGSSSFISSGRRFSNKLLSQYILRYKLELKLNSCICLASF
jgi:hypothetical protein